MSKKTKSHEELLEAALVPVEDQPYKLPGNWNWVILGGVTNFIDYRGKTPKKTVSGIPLITAKNVRMNKLNEEPREYIAHDDYEGWMTRGIPNYGDVLFTTEAPLGNVTQLTVEGRVALAQRIITIQSLVGNNTFLKYMLMSPQMQSEILKQSTGTTVQGIKASKLKLLPIPFPPLKEQKRIADKVERLLGKISQAKQLIEEAKATFELRRAAILNKAFRGELTKKWRDDQEYLKPGNIYLEEINELKLKRYKLDCDEALELGEKKPQKIKSISVVNSTEDFELPDNWITCSLGDIVYDFRYGTSSKSDYNYEGVPVLRIPNIGNEHITVEDIKYLRENQVERSNTVSEGDLLIIRSNGSKDLVGKCALVNKNCEGYAFASYLIRLRPIGVFPEYVYYLLRSENVRKQFFNKAKSSAGINNINTVELSATNIPLPSYEEQIQIVEVIKHLFSIEDEVLNRINTKDLLSSLSESVLSKAFRGELGTSNIEEENPEFLL